MPVFGVDDVLLLLASTTAVLWVKRGEIMQDNFFTEENLGRLATSSAHDTDATHLACGEGSAATTARSGTRRAATERRLCSNPRLLLRGFDLQEEQRKDAARRMLTGSPARLPSLTIDESLVRTSRVHEFADSPLVSYSVPNLPHRHYNPKKRLPHVTALATYTEDEVSQNIKKYTLAEVHALFAKMEQESVWEAVVSVTRGIENASAKLKYLTQRNVESGLRALLSAGKGDLAAAYYLSYGEDMLPGDDLVVALFDACRYMDRAALQLFSSLLPFQDRWSPVVYACCLTTAARLDFQQALRLYDGYIDKARRDRTEHQRTTAEGRRSSGAARSSFAQVLSSPSLLLQEGGLARLAAARAGDADAGAGALDEAAQRQLRNLYHVIIPMVMEKQPERALHYVTDMLRTEPGAAPDVLLQGLWTEQGRRLATEYLARLEGNTSTDPWRTWSTAGGLQGMTEPRPVGQLAFDLYKRKPSAMNMNSLLKIVMTASLAEPVSGAGVTHPRTAGRRSLPYDPALAAVASNGSPELLALFRRVPLEAREVDAAVLARSLTEHRASWAVAAQFMSAMIQRKRFAVVPALAHHLARHGQWATVARAMAVYLSNQRSAMTVPEVQLCIEATVRSGRWSSALFWVERAHGKGLALPSESYDAALSISKHCQWDASVRVLKTMHEVGGVCTERGVLSVLEAAANQGRITMALEVLAHTGGIQWMP